MDGIFRQKLLSLRAPVASKTFSEALLGDTSWLSKSLPPKTEKPVKQVFSEKVQVIESLERFAVDKSKELNTNILKVDGGEIVLKEEDAWSVKAFNSTTELTSNLKLDPKLLNVVLNEKKPGTVQALFVSEKFRNWDEISAELKEGFINELIVGFPVKTAELFERMIQAMKLAPAEVIIYSVEGSDETDYAEDVMTVAAYFKPDVIITLGARATQKILKSNDRLSLIHGQFFARKIGTERTFQVVPLFHPSIIETNMNMKKTAWADMQKIMKFLKKIP